MDKNILYVTYDGLTDMLGQSQVLPYILGLAKQGYKFTILSCEKKDRFEKSRSIIEKQLEPYGIQWEPIFFHSRPPLLAKVWDLYSIKKKALQLAQKNKFDLTHCRSYVSANVGLLLKKRYGIKFLFDLRGFWVDERVDGKIWNLNNPLYKLIYKKYKGLEKQFLEYADHSIILTEAGKKELHKWSHIKGQPIPLTVIPCSADLDHFSKNRFSAEQISERKKDLGIEEGDFVVSYLGSIGTWYLLDEMLDFFKTLQEAKPKSKFLFVTPEKRELIISRAIYKGIDPKTIVTRSESREGVPLTMLCSQVSIFFIKAAYSKISSSPTKQGEIMSLGLPVICNRGVGDVGEIVDKYSSGVAIDNLNAETYKSVVSQIDEIIHLDKEKITAGARDYYDLQKARKSYLSVYEALLK